jgi:hypothetical protein
MSELTVSRFARDRYVVVFGGARDHYQVAVALQEAEQLECLVNEYYGPAVPSWVRQIVNRVDSSQRSTPRCPRIRSSFRGQRCG